MHNCRLQANCPGFTEKNEWPPNSPDLNPLDYHVRGAMLEKYHRLQVKPKTIDELKVALQSAEHLGRAATRTHQQGGEEELHQAFEDCTG